MSRVLDVIGDADPTNNNLLGSGSGSGAVSLWIEDTRWTSRRHVAAEHGLGPVRVTLGRQDPNTTFESAAITWQTPAAGALFDPDERPSIGARVSVELTNDFSVYTGRTAAGSYAGAQTLAVGYITDVQLEYKIIAGEPVGVLNWTATGPLARMGQINIGGEPWPNDWLDTRADRIGDAAVAAMGTLPWAGDFGVVLFEPDRDPGSSVWGQDIDAQDARGLLEQLAQGTGRSVVEQRGGLVQWLRPDKRDTRTPVAEIPAAVILSSATWQNRLDAIINDLTVRWYPTGPGNAGAEIRVVDDASVARYGRYATSLESMMGSSQAITDIATLIVGRNSVPRWTIESLDLELLALDPDLAGVLAFAEIGDLISVSGLPESAPDSRYLFIEGFELQARRDSLFYTLYVSAAGQTSAALRWADIPTSTTWAAAPADMTWFQTAGWFAPPTGLKRWSDVPADTSWYEAKPYNQATWANYDPVAND